MLVKPIASSCRPPYSFWSSASTFAITLFTSVVVCTYTIISCGPSAAWTYETSYMLCRVGSSNNTAKTTHAVAVMPVSTLTFLGRGVGKNGTALSSPLEVTCVLGWALRSMNHCFAQLYSVTTAGSRPMAARIINGMVM